MAFVRTAPDVPERRDGVALAGLHVAFERAGYTAERVEERLGTHELSSRQVDTAVHLRRLGEVDDFSTLARLFLLGDDVEVDRVEQAVAPLWTEQVASLGLVEAVDGKMRALVRLVPHGDYYVASDAGLESGADVPFDHVPGIQAPSVTLAKLAVRRPCLYALDLGTGCGIQALLASKHSERVVATDVNPRALGFAAFNAALNGIHTIEFRPGDGFAPVQDERFDLIVANPPYVISPDSTYAYRDSGLPADQLCYQVVKAAAEHLTEGGFAHVLVSWAHAVDGDWADPLRGWVDGTECDPWLLHYRTSDPISCVSWLRPLGGSDPDRYTGARPLAGYLARLRIGRSGGAVCSGGARVATGSPTRCLSTAQPVGEHCVFAAQDALEHIDDEGLLALSLVLTDAHRNQQRSRSRSPRGREPDARVTEAVASPSASTGTPSRIPHFDGRVRSRRAELARRTFELDPEAGAVRARSAPGRQEAARARPRADLVTTPSCWPDVPVSLDRCVGEPSGFCGLLDLDPAEVERDLVGGHFLGGARLIRGHEQVAELEDEEFELSFSRLPRRQDRLLQMLSRGAGEEE
jgi:methylase of polypeptide subunit release factors